MTVGARPRPAETTGQRSVAAGGGRGFSALAAAWMLLLALLLALVGYILWQRYMAPQSAPQSPSRSDRAEIALSPRSATAQPAAPSTQAPALEPSPPQAPAETFEQTVLASPRLAAPATDAPWRRNALAFSVPADQPVIAVVVSGLGLSAGVTEAAITLLPPEVTLSFSPYSSHLDGWIAMARVHGHEVMLDLPMAAPGADEAASLQALAAAATPAANLERLARVLSRGRALVGVAGTYGEDFLANPTALRPVLAELQARGLLFLDNAPRGHAGSVLAAELGLAFAASDGRIDDGLASRRVLDARLVQAEDLALRRGEAVVVAGALPISIERLTTWLLGLAERGVLIAPISTVAKRNLARWEVAG